MTPQPDYRKGMRVEVYWEGRPQRGVITGFQYQDWADDMVLLITTDTGRTLRVEQERVVTILSEPTAGEVH
jgi:hypothetical protein